MRILLRLVALLVLLLCLVGIVICTAGIAGIWYVREPTIEKTVKVYDQTEQVVDVVLKGMTRLNEILKLARQNLEWARVARTTEDDARPNFFQRTMAREASQQLGVNLGEARSTLTKVQDGAIVLNAVLQNLSDSPVEGLPELDSEKMKELADRVGKMESKTAQLDSLLAGGGSSADINATTNEVIELVDSILKITDDVVTRLSTVQQRLAEYRTKVRLYMNLGVVAITVVLFWIGIAQVSLLVHAWGWLRGKRLLAVQHGGVAPGLG